MTTTHQLIPLVAVIAIHLPCLAHAQTPVEDGTNVNAWVFDADGNPSSTYRIGTGFSISATTPISGGVTVTPTAGGSELLPGATATTHVMVNRLGGSLPTPVLAPSMSVVSLGLALADTAAPTTPSVVIAPGPGTYTTTVRVIIEALAAPTGVDPLELWVSVDGALEFEVTGTTYSAYFIADGAHSVVARAVQGAAEASATATYILAGGPHKTRDSDGDGIPDGIEVDLGLDPFRDGTHDDSDGDGWSDFDEILRGAATSTGSPIDTDGDGWSDWDEELRGTDPALATSKPVAAAIDAVEYQVSGATWLDTDNTLPHAGEGFVAVIDATWQTLGWLAGLPFVTSPPGFTTTDDLWLWLLENYRRMPLATFGTLRVPGDGDVIVTARVVGSGGLGVKVFKTWVTGSPAATPALIGARVLDWSGGSAGWLAVYEDELAAYVVQDVSVDLDPESGLATALCEAAVAWAAGLDVGAPVLLGEPEGARTPEAVAAVAHAFPDLIDFVNSDGFEVAVTREDLVAELFAAPEPDQTTTWATALRVQRGAPESLAAIVRYHARLIAFGGWQRVLDFTPYDAEPESDPWLPTGDADKDGIPNDVELEAGPDAATDPLYPDSDDDGTGDLSDPCPRDPSDGCNEDAWFSSDTDDDGVLDALDNCFGVANAPQIDSNGDLIGDACEAPARIARPVANIAVLAPGQVDFTALDSAAAMGTVKYSWRIGNDERSSTKSYSMSVPADAQAQDLIIRLLAADDDTPEAEVDRRLVRIFVRHGPVPCLAMSCDDGDPCTDDACDLDTGCYSTPISGCTACTSPAECDDGNACTTDACTGDVCVLTKLTGIACDDANACSTDDLCDDGQCAGGSPLSCSDIDPCTVEHCDTVTGCVIEPDPTPDPILCPECSDIDPCAAGTCVGGLCCEATAFADGTPHTWDPLLGDPSPVFCLVAGTELDVVASVPSGGINFKLYDPSGAVVMTTPNTSVKTKRVELESLPDSGPHTLTFTATAQVTYTVTESLDVFADLAAFATPETLTVATVGAEAEVAFEGELGQVVSIFSELVTGCPQYSLVSPDGVVVRTNGNCDNSYFFEPYTLTETDTWTVLTDPGGTAVGDVSVTVWLVPPEIVVASALDGVTRMASIGTPGQTMAWTFTGAAGNRISITSNGSGGANGSLYDPFGVRVFDNDTFNGTNYFTDVLVLTETGTYRWVVDPTAMLLPTESVTAYLVPDDATATLVIGAAGTPMTVTTPGQNLAPTFVGTVGASVKIVSDPDRESTSVYTVRSSGGVTVFSSVTGKRNDYTSPAFTLPSDDTYTLFVDPAGAVVPIITLSVVVGP